MNAIELKAIVNYLIESYCDNVNGDFRYTIKEKDVWAEVSPTHYCVSIWHTVKIDAAGGMKQKLESFEWDGSEKLTMLEPKVFKALDDIYKAELIDLRKDDPTAG